MPVYEITSNRGSGFGRYNVLLEPCDKNDNVVIMEFKVHDPDDMKSLQDIVDATLAQIPEGQYAAMLVTKGIPEGKIRRYGFAFEGETVLIG